MRVSVDRDKCMGHAQCWLISPQVFVIDDRGYNNVPDHTEVPPELEERTRRAVQACPENAILVEED